MISAKVDLTQPLRQQRQFVARTGSEHYLLLDDSAGGTGPKPIELVAIGLAGCTAFDVITILRQKYHQRVTGYEVRVEADQAERPPQVFTALRIHTWSVVLRLTRQPSNRPFTCRKRNIVRSEQCCKKRRVSTPRLRSSRRRPSG